MSDAGTDIVQVAVPGLQQLRGELEELRARIRKFETRIEEVEQEVRDQDKRSDEHEHRIDVVEQAQLHLANQLTPIRACGERTEKHMLTMLAHLKVPVAA